MTGEDSQSTKSSVPAVENDGGDEKSPADQLVELLVYAPVGLLYEYQTVLDQVVKRGRSQVQLAKVMGKMAAQRGQNDVEENVGDVLTSAAETIAKGITEFGAAIGLAPPKSSSGDEAQDKRPTDKQPVETQAVKKQTVKKQIVKKEPAEEQPATAAARPLPIAGYDELKAREIIGLLPDLDRDQRARIEKHERVNRNRKTVLAKLDQLEELMEAARPASLADLAAVRWIAEEIVAEQLPARGGELFHGREAVSLVDDLEAAIHEQRLIVGTYDDVVLGFGLYSIEELSDGRVLGQIHALATLADARGSGIGEAMMNLLLDQLTKAGCFGVDSTALPGDRHTKNFFESFGLKARMLRVHKSLDT